MSKKMKRAGRVPKTGAVWHLSAEEATLAKKPRYNGYACGHGAHGDAKYNRAKQKRAWKSAIRQEGAPRGPFPVSCLSIGAQESFLHLPLTLLYCKSCIFTRGFAVTHHLHGIAASGVFAKRRATAV